MNAPRPELTDSLAGDCSRCDHKITRVIPIDRVQTGAWVKCIECDHINWVTKKYNE